MTLSRALGHIDETPKEDQYRVKLFDRLRDLLYEAEDFGFGPDATFAYSWTGGYERLEYRLAPSQGGSNYGGSYHPNEGMCEGGGICKWCGRTLW